MIKKLFLIFFLVVLSLRLIAQSSSLMRFSDIQIVENLDSLEREAIVETNAYKLFNRIALLEKSRLKYGSCQFGESLKLLDSLARVINSDYSLQVYSILKINSKIANFTNKSEVIEDFNKALSLSNKIHDTVTCASIFYSLIVQNCVGEAYENAPLSEANKQLLKSYYDRVLEITKKSTDPKLKLIECVANVEYSLNIDTSCDKVIKNAFDGLAILDRISKNNLQERNYLYTCLAACYNNNKDFKNALFYSKKCLELSKTRCSKFLGHDLFNIANCYYTIEQNDSAFKYYSKAIEAINNTKPTNLLLLEYCYDRIAVVGYYKANYKKAFEDLYARDSLAVLRTEKEKSSLSIELQHKYEYERNTQKIEVLERQKKEYVIAMVLGIIVCCSIAFLLFRNYKINRKLKHLGNFRDKVFTIISHDLRSPFSALQGLNSEASYLIKTGKYDTLLEVASGIDEASSRISNLLNNLLQWASVNKIKATEKTYLNLERKFLNVIDLYSSIISSKNIAITTDFAQVESIVANRKVFELVIRNWLDNTIKHSEATTIKIRSLKENDYYKISIIDNGKISVNTAKMIQEQLLNSTSITIQSDLGFGLELISYFSKLEKWKIDFNTGTVNEFAIYIPIVKLK